MCCIVRIFVTCIETQIKTNFTDQNIVVPNFYKLEQSWWLQPLKTDGSWYIMRIWLPKLFKSYKHKYKLPWPLKTNPSKCFSFFVNIMVLLIGNGNYEP